MLEWIKILALGGNGAGHASRIAHYRMIAPVVASHFSPSVPVVIAIVRGILDEVISDYVMIEEVVSAVDQMDASYLI
jgi:hypothetical protein